MKLVEKRVVIAAPPADVYALLTDPELFVRCLREGFDEVLALG